MYTSAQLTLRVFFWMFLTSVLNGGVGVADTYIQLFLLLTIEPKIASGR